MNPTFDVFINSCESIRRERQVVRNIVSMLKVHDQLKQYAESLSVSIERRAVVLKGQLPTDSLKNELVPAVRQAGVMWQVCNHVDVA